jgi:hypothetical protein
MPPNASNTMPGSRQRMAAGSSGTVGITTGAGAPTVNVTGLGTTTGIWWSCTATNGTSTIVWTKIGLQT